MILWHANGFHVERPANDALKGRASETSRGECAVVATGFESSNSVSTLKKVRLAEPRRAENSCTLKTQV